MLYMQHPPSLFNILLSFWHVATIPNFYILYFLYYKNSLKTQISLSTMTEQHPQTSSYVTPLASDQPSSFVFPMTIMICHVKPVLIIKSNDWPI